MSQLVEVAVTEEDIQNGVRASYDQCPIALALRRHGYNHVEVYCDSGIASSFPATADAFFNSGQWLNFQLPLPAYMFREEFDSGRPVEPVQFFLIMTKAGDDDL